MNLRRYMMRLDSRGSLCAVYPTPIQKQIILMSQRSNKDLIARSLMATNQVSHPVSDARHKRHEL